MRINRVSPVDPLILPDTRDPAWQTHLRNLDGIFFGEVPDLKRGATVWADMSVPSPFIPEGMARVARGGRFSFFCPV